MTSFSPHIVLHGFKHVEPPGNPGPAETDTGVEERRPTIAPAAPAEFRERIVQFKRPFVTRLPRFNRHHVRRKTSVFGEKRAGENVHGPDAVDGQCLR